MAKTPIDRYGIHAPTKSGKPRRLHPTQLVTRPTADDLRVEGIAAAYLCAALAALHAHQSADPAATALAYPLPNKAREAPAVRELLAEALHPLGAIVGPLKRSRGVRAPYALITWPAGWTAPALEELALDEQKAAEPKNIC